MATLISIREVSKALAIFLTVFLHAQGLHLEMTNKKTPDTGLTKPEKWTVSLDHTHNRHRHRHHGMGSAARTGKHDLHTEKVKLPKPGTEHDSKNFIHSNNADNHTPAIKSDTSNTDNHAPVIKSDTSKTDNHALVIKSDTSNIDNHAPAIKSDTSNTDNHAPAIKSDTSNTDNHAPAIKSDTSNTESNSDNHAPAIEKDTSKSEKTDKIITKNTKKSYKSESSTKKAFPSTLDKPKEHKIPEEKQNVQPEKDAQVRHEKKELLNPPELESLWYTDNAGEEHNLEAFFDEENSTSQAAASNFTSEFNDSLNETFAAQYSPPIQKCPSCQIREERIEMRKRALKQHILNMLRMEVPPNMTGRAIPKVPALAHLYGLDDSMMADSPRVKKGRSHHGNLHHGGHGGLYYTGDDDDETPVKTERVFTTARRVPVDLPLNLTDSVYFSPPVQLYNSKIRKAFLWLYIKKGVTRRRHITLVIERVLSESISSKRVIAKTIHSQKLLLSKAFGWKRVEFREMLKHWVRRPTTNYGLRIRALDDNRNNLVVLSPSSDVDKGYEPWLDTKILELRSHSRHRRSESLVCSDSSQERRCCRYPLEIGFVELGWEWVIAPLYVRADFCLGECHMAMMDDTPRSWMTQQLPGTGGVCCAPTRMQPLSLLYFDNDQNILYQILQNVKVTKCGCV